MMAGRDSCALSASGREETATSIPPDIRVAGRTDRLRFSIAATGLVPRLRRIRVAGPSCPDALDVSATVLLAPDPPGLLGRAHRSLAHPDLAGKLTVAGGPPIYTQARKSSLKSLTGINYSSCFVGRFERSSGSSKLPMRSTKMEPEAAGPDRQLERAGARRLCLQKGRDRRDAHSTAGTQRRSLQLQPRRRSPGTMWAPSGTTRSCSIGSPTAPSKKANARNNGRRSPAPPRAAPAAAARRRRRATVLNEGTEIIP
jgi:hypothetical protein